MRSFSLVEVLTVILIVGLIFLIAVGGYFYFLKKNNIDVDSQRILNILRLAKSKSVSSENLSNFGVHFDSALNTFILFSGASYNPLDANNEVYNLASEIYYQSISLNGAGNDVIFNRMFGDTSSFG